MNTASFASLRSQLTHSQYGCQWSVKHGLKPLTKEATSPYRVVIIGQLISPLTLFKVLHELGQVVEIIYLIENKHNALSASYAVNIGVALLADQTEVKQKLDSMAQRYLLDFVLQSTAPQLSEPGLLVMDMDSTMIQMECIDEIARLAGRYDEVSAVTSQAMNGRLSFAESLNTRVACLSGIKLSALEQIRVKLPLMPGLWSLVSTLKQHNWKVAIASGGFTYFADHLKEWLELDFAVSNVLEIADGCLTGATLGPIVDADKKADTLKELCAAWNISATQTCAIGDGANDLKMIDAAALGVAFHAKTNVIQQAEVVVSYQPLDAFLLLLE